MNRYHTIFQELHKKNEGCFIPFLTISDPSIQAFYQIIDILITSGIDALELGFPFSDPIADGIIVQQANIRVLSNNISITDCFNIIKQIRKKYYNIPIGILVYANIIFNKGIKKFFELCQESNIDSVLIPDIPIQESKKFEKYAKLNNISYILICPPNADKQLIKEIAYRSTGYVYLIARSGVTGLQSKTIYPNIKIVNLLKKYNSAPIIQGFGISQTNEIQKSLSLGINGIICGSIIIQIIQKYHKNHEVMLQKIESLIKKLKKSTQ